MPNMNFNFEVIAKSVPAVCIVCGVALIVGSCAANFGLGAGLFGGFLVLVGIVLQVLYLLFNR
jgi:hypothetical protein